MIRLTCTVMALLLSLVACNGTSAVPTENITPSTEPLLGDVSIIHPEDGSIIYSELLWVDGETSDWQGGAFNLHLLDLDDNLIAQANVQPENDGTWRVTLEHGYQGEPIEATLVIVSEDEQVLASRSIVIAGMAYRPEGVFGSITFPISGSSFGGDSFAVHGTASGVFENSFIVVLEAADGTVIDQEIVTAFNPFYVDEMPWETELETNGYTGEATIRAYAISPSDGQEEPLGSVNITITVAAG